MSGDFRPWSNTMWHCHKQQLIHWCIHVSNQPTTNQPLMCTAISVISITIIIILRFIKYSRPWLQRRWRQVSCECCSKALRKKYVLSLDLKTDSESTLIIVSGNEFQTVGAEQQKARLAKSVLVNGLSSSGTADERSVHSLTRALMWRLKYVGAVALLRLLKVNTATLYSILC